MTGLSETANKGGARAKNKMNFFLQKSSTTQGTLNSAFLTVPTQIVPETETK